MSGTSKLFGVSVVVLATSFAAGCGGQGSERESAMSDRASSALAKVAALKAPNPAGVAQTIRADGGSVIDPTNPFFQSLGTNGRSCATCHVAGDNMTVRPSSLQLRFTATGGTDPIFRLVDGSNSPLADVSTVKARRAAYSMLLSKGVIRVGLSMPAGAEFELLSAEDPHGFASARELSLFRRPLPATNLRFLSTVMWDGRETFKKPSSEDFASLTTDLAHQANDATLGHEQADSSLSDEQKQAIVDFETQLFTAQVQDGLVGDLDAGGALGGPQVLSTQEFFLGINDPFGLNPSGAAFTPVVMTEYEAWSGSKLPQRAAIARGEDLFNRRTFQVQGVSGLNDELGQAVVTATCTACHDTPHAGDHSFPAPLRIGTDAPSPVGGLDPSGLPVYTLQNKTTGEVTSTTDPGRAMITGKWKDIGRFKGPVLRGLAGRAPYFHNGSAATLADVVHFYDARFDIGLTDAEEADLVAFLGAL